MGMLPRQTSTKTTLDSPDRPWIFRTYAGHSSAAASNELFRSNLAKGQTGLSIAFDLPTQCGYSSDHSMARPEIGKVGVPINSLDDFHVLFKDIPIEQMNTSMTINATSMWLFALYLGLARERNVDIGGLRGTTQNDITKEYLARGTYVFPPEASFRLIAEMYEYCLANVPKWNPSNTCSYHLQEAGATPVQEVAFALANVMEVLDLIRDRGNIAAEAFHQCVGRMSFFVNAGMRFVEELCKMRAFVELWDEITQQRYGVTDPRLRRFRYGVQVNSLGLTKQQPENNAWRILIEALGVTLSRKARCRALQLPAWNEALSLPRAWDQQWSLRLQQILALETDLLEYPDLFDGSPVVMHKTADIKDGARRILDEIRQRGGVRESIDSGYLKHELVRSMTKRMAKIESGDQTVIGVNTYAEGLESPLVSGEDGGTFRIKASVAKETLAQLEKTKANRDEARAVSALQALRQAALDGINLIEPSVECALARVTTGEWTETLREVFGEYRPDTGIAGQSLGSVSGFEALQSRAHALESKRGRRPKIVVGKPGLDGHSNGAEMIAVAARDAGFDVVYTGIRHSPDILALTAVEEGADVLGLSVLSGSHQQVVADVIDALKRLSAPGISVVVGGIIPDEDAGALRALGVADVFTPSDYQLSNVMARIMDIVEGQHAD